jgi:hypothetical protein
MINVTLSIEVELTRINVITIVTSKYEINTNNISFLPLKAESVYQARLIFA